VSCRLHAINNLSVALCLHFRVHAKALSREQFPRIVLAEAIQTLEGRVDAYECPEGRDEVSEIKNIKSFKKKEHEN
jgi:hypothetical protein